MKRVAVAFDGVKFMRKESKFTTTFLGLIGAKFKLLNAVNFAEFDAAPHSDKFGAVKFMSNRLALSTMLAAFFKFNKILPALLKFDPSNSAVNFKILSMLGAKFFKFALAEFALRNLLKFKLATTNLPPQKVKFDA